MPGALAVVVLCIYYIYRLRFCISAYLSGLGGLPYRGSGVSEKKVRPQQVEGKHTTY